MASNPLKATLNDSLRVMALSRLASMLD